MLVKDMGIQAKSKSTEIYAVDTNEFLLSLVLGSGVCGDGCVTQLKETFFQSAHSFFRSLLGERDNRYLTHVQRRGRMRGIDGYGGSSQHISEP